MALGILCVVQKPFISEAANVKMRFNRSIITLKKGEKYKLNITKKKNVKKIRSIKWSSSRKCVALVSSKGIVNAKNKGAARITAKITYKTKGSTKYRIRKLKCKVYVKSKEVPNDGMKSEDVPQENWARVEDQNESKDQNVQKDSGKPENEDSQGTTDQSGETDKKEGENTQSNQSAQGEQDQSGETDKKEGENIQEDQFGLDQPENQEQPEDVLDEQPEVLPVPPEGAFYYADDKIVLNREFGNRFSDYAVREWSSFYHSYYYILPTCGVETEKEYIGTYGNAAGTELVDYYTIDSKSVIYVKPFYYSHNQETMKYEKSDSTEFADINEYRKYISFRCCSAGGGMTIPPKGSLRYETSNEDVIYVHPGIENHYQCYLLPVGEGTSTISVYYNDILILSRTYSVGHYDYETQYSYRIMDVSTSDVWYAMNGGRLLYIETDNPDPETFCLYSYGIKVSTCRMYALNADIVWDEKMSYSYTATLAEKYNYYPSADGKGYYIPIKSDVAGTALLSVEENGHIVPDVFMKLECVTGYLEKLQEWYDYVEMSAGVEEDMDPIEKVRRVATWLHMECYYPTMVYYNGKLTGYVYPDEPTWITPVFDCVTSCYHLEQIIKDYEGVDSVVFDTHASDVTINGVLYTFNPTPDRRLKPNVYIENE